MSSTTVTVAELIAALQKMPQDRDVVFIYDGFIRCDANSVWVSRRGQVVISEADEDIYDEANQPEESLNGKWDSPLSVGA